MERADAQANIQSDGGLDQLANASANACVLAWAKKVPVLQP